MHIINGVKISDWVALFAVIISLGALGWTIRESNLTSNKLKLIDRPKIALLDIRLIPYETKTEKEFKGRNWEGEVPLIFSTSSKHLFDHGKYDRISVLKNDHTRLQGQVNLINKGVLECSNLKGSLLPYFNGEKVEKEKIFNCVNTLFPDETFNVRFVCFLPSKNIRNSGEELCLNLKLEYDGPNSFHHFSDFWYIYDSKTNNWNHCSQKDINNII